MSAAKCPDCGRLIATAFSMHECKPKNGYRNDLHRLMCQPKSFFKPKPMKTVEKHDRLTIAARFTANKPLTRKQWQDIQKRIADAIENTILESESLTKKIGNVHLGSPWDNGIEICV